MRDILYFRYVYGVKRTASDSTVTAGRVDVEGFDGVKAYQYALQRDGTAVDNRVWGKKYHEAGTSTNSNNIYVASAVAADATIVTETDATYISYGGNPIFKVRGKYYGNCGAATSTTDCYASNTVSGTTYPYVLAGQKSNTGTCSNGGAAQCDTATASTQGAAGTSACIVVGADSLGSCPSADVTQLYFMGDGREDAPGTSVTTASTLKPQEMPYTRCLVCHGSQEFLTPPSAANQISDPCWNPSGSSIFSTTAEATMDPRLYCQPANGFCSTTTWQYSTKDTAGTTTSHWVGVERGCASTSTTQTLPSYNDQGNDYNFKRGLSSTYAYVRYHAATNTASKAKDNAKV